MEREKLTNICFVFNILEFVHVTCILYVDFVEISNLHLIYKFG